MQAITRVTNPWDDMFFECVRNSRKIIRIASPFVKDEVARALVREKPLHVRLEYINSFKLQYFYSGASDLMALQTMLDTGASIRNLHRLHSKLYIFDDTEVVITSANLTWGGLRRNHEYGVLIKDPSFVHDVASDFARLFDSFEETGAITETEIKIAASIIESAPRHVQVRFPVGVANAEINDEFVGGTSSIEQSLSGWILEVYRCVKNIPSKVFTLSDIYQFEPHLQKLYPTNQFVKDKIRQQLQFLRDRGLLEFYGNGTYRKLWQE